MADAGSKVCHAHMCFSGKDTLIDGSNAYAAQMENAASFSSLLPSAWWVPQWPAIAGVQAVFTTRHGGVSQAPWDSLNLGVHVGDAAPAVAQNRRILECSLSRAAGRGVALQFLNQVHGWQVQMLPCYQELPQADACVTHLPGHACTIMVADCLPVLIAHRKLGVVGAAHAGWRGLLGYEGVGVLEALWQAYTHLVRKQDAGASHEAIAAYTQVWLGPCIGPTAFEVGAEVYQAFVQEQAQAQHCFARATPSGKWWADLAGLARQRLQTLGVTQVYGNDSSQQWCTFGNPSQFFSHRRDAAVRGSTGRMAAAIWCCADR